MIYRIFYPALFFAVIFSFFAGSVSPVFSADAEPANSSSGPAVADFSEPKSEEEADSVQLEDLPPDMPVAEFVEGTPQSNRKYFYEKPTMKALSHLYFAINYVDVDNDVHIDNYLRINECKLFRKYNSSEFQMKEIRDATRKFIIGSRSQFSTRFELKQQIDLLDYDLERRAFKIEPRSQIQGIRRFELFTTDNFEKARCGFRSKQLEGFPFSVILEVSRPFTLTYVPVPVDTALQYIAEKDKIYQKLPEKRRNKDTLYKLRKAYIVFYVKVFAFRKLDDSSVGGFNALQTLAVMEGFEVYGDPGGKNLFYAKSFLDATDPKAVNEKLMKEYEILKGKIEGSGMLH